MATFKEGHGLYPLLLVSIFIVGLSLTSASREWQTVVTREKEAELLFRGDAILRGIERYHKKNMNSAKPYPDTIDELLYDDSGLTPVRYLRKKYRDPFSKTGRWGLIRDKKKGGITGIFSKSSMAPIKRAGFPEKYESFKKASSYANWRFVLKPPKTGNTNDKNNSSL